MNMRRLVPEDLPKLRQFWVEHWGANFMVVHGKIYQPEQLNGFVAEEDNEWFGLITFVVKDNETEVISLDSLRKGQGIGNELMKTVVNEAQQRNCKRIFLITTNDNLNALGFYQRHGFELVRIDRGAVHESRKIKPTIPLIGENNIPLRDEIELEMNL